MSLVRTLTSSSSTVSSVLRISSRGKHFLADIPLKKRGVDGNVAIEDIQGKLTLLYFSAGWCGSCKMLTPKLKKFYEGLGDRSKDLEVVWVSRDREADHQLEYYEKAMPAWSYVPFGDPGIQALLEKFNVATIPSVKLVNDNGDVISERARADVEGCIKDKSDPLNCYDAWKKL